MQLIGIDLAWQTNKNPTAMAFGYLSSGVLNVTAVDDSIYSVEGILERIQSVKDLQGVAVDASLIIPNSTGQRRCEKEIFKCYGARGASCHASNTTLYPNADSVLLSERLQSMGFDHLGEKNWQIECYPHPAIIEIFGLPQRLAYKKGRVAEKKAGQKKLVALLTCMTDSPVLPMKLDGGVQKYFDGSYIDGLRGKAIKTNEDALDAIVCLYIAGLYAIGFSGRVFGNVGEGYIWVPQASVLPN